MGETTMTPPDALDTLILFTKQEWPAHSFEPLTPAEYEFY
jgi:hypothetical protein